MKSKIGGLIGAFVLMPLISGAHTVSASSSGWSAGFDHPFQGWDHLLAMLMVGAWAAQSQGRCLWWIPTTFVVAMVGGGWAGANGWRWPGVEAGIAGSVAVFGLLAALRIQPRLVWSLPTVAAFAFFHGMAHGAEMPLTTSTTAFGLGFAVSTLLLQGAGWLTGRAAALGFACVIGGATTARAAEEVSTQPTEPVPAPADTILLPSMLIQGRGDSLIGLVDSATMGTVGYAQLSERPILRAGEILETVPGVIITQHAGGGKANQYFLRGFNLDHGTDFLTTLDGMPVNLPTHGHGQGYTDLNIVIPELVRRVNYQKGVYYAENGDFSSAGAAHLETFQVLDQSIAQVEGGMYGYGRAVFASSPRLGEGHLLYGLEAFHHDGPWENPDDFQRFNGQLTYSHGDDANGFRATFRGYHGRWDSSDQVAASAIDDGWVPFFGSLDDTTGGDSQRYSLQTEWHRRDERSASQIQAYGYYYDLDLFSNFTYFLTDTNRGDQFEQTDRRVAAGLEARHTFFHEWDDRDVQTTVGLQFRNDDIRNGLFNTEARRRVDKINADDGSLIPAVVREDEILQTSLGVFIENRTQWTDTLRTVAGIRGDGYRHDVTSTRAENSGDRTDAIASPKFSVVLGPWNDTEVYVQGGLGFHSNDGRGATTRVDPVTGLAVDADGNPIHQADPLVPTYGAEVGVRTTAIKGLQSTVSLWWLDIDSELLFVGDAGSTEASRPSRRYGVEWANYYHLAKDLTLDFDVSFSHAEFRDDAPEGDHIPGSIESVVAAGLSYQSDTGFFGSLRLRYFGPRPLVEDDSIRSGETVLLGASLGYRFRKTWTVSAEIFNLLDRRDYDIEYAYESRVRPGDTAVMQRHFHPVEPIQARFMISARF